MRGVKKRQGKVTTSMTPSPALSNLALPSSDVDVGHTRAILQHRRLPAREPSDQLLYVCTLFFIPTK